MTRLLRSVLYLPASNPRAVEKARTLDCDAVVLDLEDAVAPEAKPAARAAAVAALAAGGFRAPTVAVRVNALDTEWGQADLAALSGARPAAVVLPKVDAAAHVTAACAHLDPAIPVWAMVETARSLFRLDDIAGAPGLDALVVGTNDLAREMRTRLHPDRAAFLGILALTVAAARAHNRAVLDGVYNDLADEPGFAAQCTQAVDLGFDGKTLLHPRQIAPCNQAFTPPDAEVTRARAVIAAFDQPDNRNKGVIALDGRMVERLHLEEANRTLALFHAASR